MRPEQLLTTNLSLPGSIKQVEALPPEMLDLDEVIIEVKTQPEPTWLVAGVKYDSLESVAGVLKTLGETNANLPVLLDIAPGVELGTVIDIYDLCRLSGLLKVQFAAELK